MAKSAYCVIATGERPFYGCFLPARASFRRTKRSEMKRAAAAAVLTRA